MNESAKTQCSNPNCKCDPCMCDPCLCGVKPATVPYKGRTLTITTNPDGTATVDIDGRVYSCTRHIGGHHGGGQHGGSHLTALSRHASHGDSEPAGMPMWMCDESYFGSFDLIDVARHLADYSYIYDDPNRIICDADGNVVTPPRMKAAKKSAAKKSAAKKSAAKKSTAKKRASKKSR